MPEMSWSLPVYSLVYNEWYSHTCVQWNGSGLMRQGESSGWALFNSFLEYLNLEENASPRKNEKVIQGLFLTTWNGKNNFGERCMSLLWDIGRSGANPVIHHLLFPLSLCSNKRAIWGSSSGAKVNVIVAITRAITICWSPFASSTP